MSAEQIDPNAFSFALQEIDDGFVFEEFAKQFVSQVVGYELIPVGGLKDRGIDSLQHIFHRKNFDRWIYQISIEKSSESKIHNTAVTLSKNDIGYDRLMYITNQDVNKKDNLVDSFHEKFNKPLTIFDREWFSINANRNNGTQNAFRNFAITYLHKYNQPGTGYIVSDLVTDPRLYVFLRQQWDSYVQTNNMTEVLTDTLILFALEGTDPEKDILKTESEIIEEITKKIQFDPSSITLKIDDRLKLLSKKPRKIQYHSKKDAYCLPFETRCEIQDRNLKDAALYKNFRDQSKKRFLYYLDDVRVRDSIDLLESVLHRLFYQQGLEFSSFVLKGENKDAIEKNLVDFISQTVEEKNIIPKNRDHVISALHMTIRDIVYNGTLEQKGFLGRLANTYMMLFLLQVDPKVTTYFGQMASELRIYVDNSIIIPALSEYYLSKNNRRYWDLLKKASDAGIKLIIEEQIIEELASHFSMIQNTYDMIYKDNESMYTDDESLVLYIDEIMIRSYFYAKIKNQVNNFENFIDQFVDFGSGSNNKDELIILLREEFGINFISSENIRSNVSEEDFQALYDRLRSEKSHAEKARTDARLILTIYEERQQNEETSTSGIFGYKTWWLSSDTTTQKAVNNVFGDRFNTSCYIRPDFLFNFICLSPNIHDVNETFNQLFPSLLGVNISYHLPLEVMDVIQDYIKEHSEKRPARVKAKLKGLVDRLKSDANFRNKNRVKHFLDQERDRMSY